jgi:hypothetical protein
LVTFVADYANGSGCGDDLGNKGCDVYLAAFDPKGATVAAVRAITANATPESFPTYRGPSTGDGRFYFRSGDGQSSRSIGFAIDGAFGTLLATASSPMLRPSTSDLLYVDKDNNLAIAHLGTDGKSVTSSASVTASRTPPRGDPNVSRDGKFVVFNETGEGVHGTSQAKVINLDTLQEVNISEKDGSGHCAFSWSGTMVVCDSRSSGELTAWDFDGKAASNKRRLVRDPVQAELDDDYSGCGVRSVNYPTFCGDDEHVGVAVSCSKKLGDAGTGSAFSKLFLVDLSKGAPVYKPLGRDLAAKVGGIGKYEWTPECRESEE